MRFGMLINLKKCVGCYACTVACQNEHDLPFELKYCRVNRVGPTGTYPNVSSYNIPLACMHCEDAPCVTACPTGASHTDKETNTVQIESKKCVGCLYCMLVCPYDARRMNPKTKTVDKCVFCLDRMLEGGTTRCTETCQLKARLTGDLDDPNSQLVKEIVRLNAKPLHEQLGTKPSIYYVMP